MKITIDTKTGEVKSQGKLFQELDEIKRNVVESFVRDFLRKNTQLTDYEEDCMWMSYRYCIGRHTIASSMRAGDIASHYYGRMSEERYIITAYDKKKKNKRCINTIKRCQREMKIWLNKANIIFNFSVNVKCSK